MKKLTLLLSLFAITLLIYGQQANFTNREKSGKGPYSSSDLGNPPAVNWIEKFGGDGTDAGQDAITDADGNIYVTGYFSGPISFGSTSLTSVGYVDAFIAKLTNSGTLVWLKQLSCQPYEIVKGLAITLDNNNNAYITGYYNGATLNLGSATLTRTGIEDLFIAKFSQAGDLLVANHYGVPGEEHRGRSIAADESMNIYIVNGGLLSTSNGGQYISKFSAAGQFQMDYFNGAYFYDIKSQNDLLYVTGYLTGSADFGIATLTATSSQTAPFAGKLNNALNFVWAVQGISSGTGSAYNRAFSLSLDASNNVYITGRFRKNLTFGNTILTNLMGDYAPYVAKLDPTGAFLWARQATIYYFAGYSNYSKPVNISADASGILHITCELAFDTLDFGGIRIGGSGFCTVKYGTDGTEQWAVKQPGTIFEHAAITGGKVVFTGFLAGNVLVSKIDGYANPEWSIQSAGNSGTAQVVSLENNSIGQLYVYGKTEVKTDLFGSTTGTFLAKMQPDGEVLWSVPFTGGSVQTGYGDCLSVDRNGNIGVMGNFSDTLKIGNKTLINASGNKALFVAKIDPEGNVLWLKQVGTGPQCTESSLTADHDGNLIACGTFSGSYAVGSFVLESAGSQDAFLAKYDPNGILLWARRAGGEEIEYEAFASTDSSNNIYLTGEFTSRNITFGNEPLTLTEFDGDVLLARYSPDGVYQWGYAYGADPTGGYGRYDCWPTAIKTSAGGDSYLYGWTGLANYYGPFFLESQYNYNFFLTKINQSGIVQWAKIIKEKKYGWHSLQIDLDDAGNLYLGGNFNDTLFFDNQLVDNQGELDLFFGKYKDNGSLDWVKLFNSNPMGHSARYLPSNFLNAITVYDAESFYIGGSWIYDLQLGTNILHSSNTNGFIALVGKDIPYGIDQLAENQAGLTVYPNPATDKIHINAGGFGPGKISVSILSIEGQILQKTTFGSNPSVISVTLPDLPSGIYCAKLESDHKVVAAKFVVQ